VVAVVGILLVIAAWGLYKNYQNGWIRRMFRSYLENKEKKALFVNIENEG
jgi:hypothetical protein